MNEINIAKLSNSFSTGDGGGNFERHVQAVFLLALLIDGFSPILEKPVARLDFQGKRLGYDIDDLIVTAAGSNAPMLLCQIKHDISITAGNKLFQEVICAAWSDFKKSNFRVEKDKIVLATGMIAKNSIFSMRYINDQANLSLNGEDFLLRIEQSNYTSNKAREVFDILKKKLTLANCDMPPSEDELWHFCKSFTLLVFDLDYQSSLNRVLIHSLIKSQSAEDAKNVWARLSDFAGDCNQGAGSICLKNIPTEIKKLFNSEKLKMDIIMHAQRLVPTEFWASLSLIGAWNESNKFDIEIVEQITELTYNTIETKLHQLIIEQSPYITYNNGSWKLCSRESLFHVCKGCFFDKTIRRSFDLAATVLLEKDVRFDENNEFSLVMPGTGAFRHSDSLRKGFIQGLCMLSNYSGMFPSCSYQTIESCSFMLIRNVFADCDWTRFASLYDILPLVAEINPKQYLDTLDKYIQKSKNELINLCPKTGKDALFSPNFIYGIIWSVEVLAWDEKYLVACVRCLGELADGLLPNKENSEIAVNAIKDILLPWHPQTMASADKQKNAVQTLQTEMPDIGWTVIKTLLPNGSSMTGGTQKPKYIIQDIPKELTVSNTAIAEFYRYYTGLAVALASKNASKTEELAEYIEYFDEDTIEIYLLNISEIVHEWPEEEQYAVWNKLSDIKYRILCMNKKNGIPHTPLFDSLCSTIDMLTPQNKLLLYRRLYFANFDEYMQQEDDIISEWDKKELEKRRAIQDVYLSCGIECVEQYGICVNDLYDVGNKLGQCVTIADIQDIIEKGYTKVISTTFLYSIVQGFVNCCGIDSIMNSGIQNYSNDFISDLLSHMYLSSKLLSVVKRLLPTNEKLFWTKIVVPRYLHLDDDIDVGVIVDNLMNANRAVAAITLCGNIRVELTVSDEKITEMLKLAATTESAETLDTRAACSLIKRLQSTKTPNIKELSEIEFLYLPLLTEFSSVHPRAIYFQIANNPSYFCELLQLAYKKRHETVQAINSESVRPELSKRLFQILFKFCVVPGVDWNGNFHDDVFAAWIENVKTWARENDRYEIAMQTIGNGLSYAQVDEYGIPCSSSIVKALNAADAEEIRKGYRLGLYNQRGVHWVDPEGKAERSLSEKYTRAADQIEGQGYSRFSELLRDISRNYIAEANQNAMKEKMYREENS